ncbi:MAG: serine/threonine protein kinase [Sphingomonadales bacterium]|nr:serine/threonine protein kinase [Sphingomonadales bacterium]
MDIEREKRVIKLFEEALDWPAAARTQRLTDLLSGEPEILHAVLAMIAADHSSALLPTIPPEPAELGTDTPMPERIGNYRIVEEIGRGGMGLVYRAARDDGLFDQQVAIKVIRRTIFSATTHEQFANERRILARLHHPHIAHLLDGGVSEDGSPYIIMELIKGVPITDYVQAQDLDLAARLALFRDACNALEYAHRELVVHADVKPSNVVVAEGFGVKLLDFGIARLVGEDGGRASSAHTPGYSSPARVSGERSTPTDDVFALGVLLDQLIAGVAGVDEDLHAVAAMAAQEDAAQRYGAVTELIADLDRWQRHEPVAARPPDRRRGLLLLWRRNRLLIAGGIALAIVALAMTGLFFRAASARDAAEQRFAETRSLSNFLVSDVVTDLETMPGTGPMRQRIADRARIALEKLSQVPGAPIDLQIETANAYARVGEILAAEDLRDVMDPATGDAVLARAERALRGLIAKRPDRADLRLSLAKTLYARALFSGEAKIDQKRTFAVLDEIETLLKPIGVRDSNNFSARLLQVRAHLLRADSYSTEAQYAEAIASIKTAINLLDAIQANSSRQRADLALSREQSHTLLGDAIWYSGNEPGSLQHYLAGKEALSDPAVGSDIRVLKRQAYTTFTVASSLFGLGKKAEGLTMSEAGLAEIERWRRFDDSANARRMENIVREEYSYELQNSGRIAEAYRQNDLAIAGYRENARMQPNNYQVLRALPVALRPSGDMYRDTGNPEKACERFREANAIWTRLERENRVSAFDLGNDVELIKARLAKC